MAAHIRVQYRQRIARPCFDTEVLAPPSNAKDQNEVRFFSEELGQIAINGRIAGGKHMGRANDISERGPASAREFADQNGARIEGYAGKRTEAGENDAHRVSARACRQSVRLLQWEQGVRPRHRLRCAAVPLSAPGRSATVQTDAPRASTTSISPAARPAAQQARSTR